MDLKEIGLDGMDRIDLAQDSDQWRAQLSRFVLPHPPEDGDRSSLRNVVVFFVFHIQDDG
jgi:hypothetical protein